MRFILAQELTDGLREVPDIFTTTLGQKALSSHFADVKTEADHEYTTREWQRWDVDSDSTPVL